MTTQFQQHTQFTNQFSAQQSFQTLPNATNTFDDTVLHVDYGVIEAYNVGLQSAHDITSESLSAGANTTGQRFDVAKAMFNQADINHDGSITRDEFRQWAQNGPSYSNVQTTSIGTNSGNADIANILRQSGLA